MHANLGPRKDASSFFALFALRTSTSVGADGPFAAVIRGVIELHS
jgi:hypothetical protein